MMLYRPLIQFWSTVVVSPDQKDKGGDREAFETAA